jgi:serine protease DegQ
MRRLWLIFAQTVTISLAVYFVISTLKPEWLDRASSSNGSGSVVQLVQSSGGAAAPSSASYSDAARKVLPSVVHIFTTQAAKQSRHPLMDDPLFRHFFGEGPGEGRQRSSGLGSGVVVSSDGYVLTNFHVIEAADVIELALNDGRKLKATLVGSDPETDLAVLRITVPNGQQAAFSPITLGRMESVRVGDVVLAIGNPFGVGQSVTMGIVSALGRTQLGINTFEDFIQTDAAINPGNSGGALIDAAGNLIGINTAIYSRSGGSLGIGFAIPVSTARSVMEQIIQNGNVTRGWIGIEAQEITPEIAEAFGLPGTDGALIAGVVRNSPADVGGLRPGDVLLAVGGKPVRDPQVMLDLIAALKPGETVGFKLRRDKAIVEQQVRIGKRPAPPRGRRE